MDLAGELLKDLRVGHVGIVLRKHVDARVLERIDAILKLSKVARANAPLLCPSLAPRRVGTQPANAPPSQPRPR